MVLLLIHILDTFCREILNKITMCQNNAMCVFVVHRLDNLFVHFVCIYVSAVAK